MNLNDMLEHAEALTVMGKSHATHEFPPANIHKRLFVYWEWATFGSPKMIELTSIHPLTYAFLLGLGFVVSAVSVAQRRRNIPLPPGPSQVDIVPDKQYVHLLLSYSSLLMGLLDCFYNSMSSERGTLLYSLLRWERSYS